jgi:hypothetical protein
LGTSFKNRRDVVVHGRRASAVDSGEVIGGGWVSGVDELKDIAAAVLKE